MERYRSADDALAVKTVLATLPPAIQDLLRGVHVVTDIDPAYIGLHYYRDTGDGRSYAHTSHCVWVMHQLHLPKDRRETTVVLLDGYAHDRFMILHEFGHALDERLNFDRPDMKPINDYAARNRYEAFAEAFRWWCEDMPFNDTFYTRTDLKLIDPAAVAFFDGLAAREAISANTA